MVKFMDDLKQHRKLFPGLDNKVYFNYGGQGTMPTPALEAIIAAYQYIQKHGPFSGLVNDWIKEKIFLLKEAIASELMVKSDTLTITENVTSGCNIVLWGLDWHKGDHLLISDCEHPGVVATVREIARRYELNVSVCPLRETLNHGDPVSIISKYLQPDTRLVVLSHLLWNNGGVLPLKEIVQLCHQHSNMVRVLVDAAQSVGCLPVNLQQLDVDFYAFTGHKWLCGPEGVGGLYIHPQALPLVNPTFIGWRGVEIVKGEPKNWKPDGQRFEVATSAFPLYEGLRVAIATHQSWGTSQERYEQLCYNSKYLWENLRNLSEINCLKILPPEAGLVSFQVKGNIAHDHLVKVLEQQGFLLRTIAGIDCIRACVHYLTLVEEIDLFIERFPKIFKNL